jgi:hypothetical protein
VIKLAIPISIALSAIITGVRFIVLALKEDKKSKRKNKKEEHYGKKNSVRRNNRR